jgi:hypothetical protein
MVARPLVFGTTVAALVGVSAVAPAQAATTLHATGSSTAVELAPAPVSGQTHTAAGVCEPRLNWYNRTQLCWKEITTIDIYNEEGDLVGTIVFDTLQTIQLHAIGRTFGETFDITSVIDTGEVPTGITLDFSAYCARPCTATVDFSNGSPLAVGTGGTIAHSDAVASGKKAATLTHYQFLPVAPDATFTPLLWKTPTTYRCDDMLKGQGAGCVFNKYAPTMTTMTQLPAIATNIKKIQTDGPGHYGRPYGKHALNRLTDQDQIDKNRNAVCSKKVTGPPPKKGESCDEYPFASTYEGGTKLSEANRGWTWVPVGEQNKQGPRIKNFYYGNRVLDDDAFYVKV